MIAPSLPRLRVRPPSTTPVGGERMRSDSRFVGALARAIRACGGPEDYRPYPDGVEGLDRFVGFSRYRLNAISAIDRA